MNPKNLKRAKEIAEQLPLLEDARSILSSTEAQVIVEGHKADSVSMPSVSLPKTINYNLLGLINAEINRLKEETKTL